MISQKYDVLFLCNGNIIRSRLAEEILKKMRPDLKITSSGVGLNVKFNRLFNKKMRIIAEENRIEYDIKRRSKEVSLEEVENSKIIFLMDKKNYNDFKIRFGEKYLKKVKFLGNVIGIDYIKDPAYSKGTDKYYETFFIIYECCKKISKWRFE